MRTDDLPIASPCGQDWTGMKPAGMKKRFCDTCKMHVHDLSKMSRREAKTLLSSEATEGLCIRYLHDQHGDIVFTDSLVRAKRFALGALAVAMPMTLTACMGAAPARPMPKAPPAAQEQPTPVLPVAK